MITQQERQKALLIATFTMSTDREECHEHLKELSLLVDTYGVDTLYQEGVQLREIDASTFIRSGKLEELVQKARELRADFIVMDDEITPAQQRNLEEAFGMPVMDRTEVILGVFGMRAQTKEAKLQIDLAKKRYELPRLKRLWTHLSRQRGGGGGSSGGGYQKGEGEKQIEIDKRLIKDQIDKLNKEIAEVKLDRETQRIKRKRQEIPSFAIVGYTNAGKSTLLNALTDANVFVEDKLFATLDTTTRKFTLPNNQDILLVDTVGFIRKLPHLLIAAFKSTLEESLESDILLHVIDVNNPLAEEQAQATMEVLKELNADQKPIINILNKVDLCPTSPMITKLKIKYPKNVTLSGLQKSGFDDLFYLMVEEMKALRQFVVLQIPQSDYGVISELRRLGRVLKQEYEENDVIVHVEIPKILLSRYKDYEKI
jgi:GTP-binding protein HflX